MKTRAQAKRDLEVLQMEVDEPSYDILEWFHMLPHVYEDVFKYLDGKDVIQASAVNKKWRKFTAESQQWKNVKLVFNGDNLQKLNREAVHMIKKGKRKYHNIEFRNIPEKFTKYVPKVLENGAGSWKSVKMSDCEILDQEMWTAFFGIIEPSIEEFSITEKNRPQQPLEAKPEWTFPCLKDLKSDHNSSEMCRIFVRCTSLVNLDWKGFGSASIEVKKTLLRNNHNLKDLAVTTVGISVEDFVDFKFKLKKLRLEGSLTNRTPGIVHSFLETQSQTLESLKLEKSNFSRDNLELILNMPRLTSLTTCRCGMMTAIADVTRQLPENASITYLELNGCICNQQSSYETLFRALTSLKHFKCGRIFNRMLLDLAQEVPALESIEMKIFDVSRFPKGDIFPNIRKLKVEYWHVVQEPASDGNFASLVRQEMRSYDLRIIS